MSQVFMTQKGYDKLKAELEHMEQVEMPAIVERLAAARAEGDLSENAEYHGCREAQGMLDAKMCEIRYKLSVASIVDESMLPKDEIAFGSTFKARDLDMDEVEIFTLVGAGEDNPRENRIQVSSPLAQGFLGHKVGDKVDIEVPMGTLHFEILEICKND